MTKKKYVLENPDCEKCHCNGCANFCFLNCTHSCGCFEPDFPYKVLCKIEPENKEKVDFT